MTHQNIHRDHSIEADLARRLAWLRLDRHWSQRYLAARMGVATSTITAWESGKVRPGHAHRVTLGKIFKTSFGLENLGALGAAHG